MKNFVFIFVLCSSLLCSCNKEKIADLEFENGELQQQVTLLEKQVKFLEHENDIKYRKIKDMELDFEIILNHARSASSHASSASFWAQNGNTFLYKSAIEQMASDFESIVHIASKY